MDSQTIVLAKLTILDTLQILIYEKVMQSLVTLFAIKSHQFQLYNVIHVCLKHDEIILISHVLSNTGTLASRKLSLEIT